MVSGSQEKEVTWQQDVVIQGEFAQSLREVSKNDVWCHSLTLRTLAQQSKQDFSPLQTGGIHIFGYSR